MSSDLFVWSLFCATAWGSASWQFALGSRQYAVGKYLFNASLLTDGHRERRGTSREAILRPSSLSTGHREPASRQPGAV